MTTFLTNAIKGWTILNKTTKEYLDGIESERQEKAYNELKEVYKELGDDAKELALKRGG